eukprot:14520555-Alexandrium_andersonii.AAC.1
MAASLCSNCRLEPRFSGAYCRLRRKEYNRAYRAARANRAPPTSDEMSEPELPDTSAPADDLYI